MGLRTEPALRFGQNHRTEMREMETPLRQAADTAPKAVVHHSAVKADKFSGPTSPSGRNRGRGMCGRTPRSSWRIRSPGDMISRTRYARRALRPSEQTGSPETGIVGPTMQRLRKRKRCRRFLSGNIQRPAHRVCGYPGDAVSFQRSCLRLRLSVNQIDAKRISMNRSFGQPYFLQSRGHTL